MSIAKNIRRIRSKSGLTQEEFGRVAGVSAMAVSQWENGRAVPRMGAVQRISDYFNISKGDVIDEGMARAVTVAPSAEVRVPVRVIGHVHAGSVEDEDESDLTVAVAPSVLAGHPNALGLVVDGDCMNRVIPEGYIALYDPDKEPRNGQVVIAEVEPGRAVMRRWLRGSNTLMLVADSTEDHEDIVLSADEACVRVLGVVFHACTPDGWEA